MYPLSKQIVLFFHYWLTASNGKGHGIHSPFVFEFITKVLNDRSAYPAYKDVEKLRRDLLRKNHQIAIEDYGAGAKAGLRTIADIAERSARPKKYAQLLFRIANHYQPQQVLELGSSLGVSTAYLALGAPDAQVISGEGDREVAAQARINLEETGVRNTQIVTGNFDDTLVTMLQMMPQIDLVFIDGNHRKEPTIRYFNELLPRMSPNSIMIFDDINWSEEMRRAWQYIRSHPSVMLTIDLFFMGIVVFRRDFKVKQHFTIRF